MSVVEGAPIAPPPFNPKSLERNWRRGLDETVIRIVLFIAAAIGVLTTAGILFSLASETVAFFQQVSFAQFFGDTRWTPLFSSQRFGIWALVSATVLTSFIALLIAIPIGLVSAIYLSEFAKPATRDKIKPLLEVLAGVPTVVYGFFALTVRYSGPADLQLAQCRLHHGHHDRAVGLVLERGCALLGTAWAA
jgi:ABC-type phosphate transport system permease subunit